MAEIRPRGQVASIGHTLSIFLKIYIALFIVGVLLMLLQMGQGPYSGFGVGRPPPLFFLMPIVSAVASILSMVVIVLFLVWQAMAAGAVYERGDIFNPPISPGWHVGWWFIPFANLVMPAIAMGQLYRASIMGPGRTWDAIPFPKVVLRWWLWWLLAPFLFVILAILIGGVGGAIIGYGGVLISHIVATMMVLGLIREISDAQDFWRPQQPASV